MFACPPFPALTIRIPPRTWPATQRASSPDHHRGPALLRPPRTPGADRPAAGGPLVPIGEGAGPIACSLENCEKRGSAISVEARMQLVTDGGYLVTGLAIHAVTHPQPWLAPSSTPYSPSLTLLPGSGKPPRSPWSSRCAWPLCAGACKRHYLTTWSASSRPDATKAMRTLPTTPRGRRLGNGTSCGRGATAPTANAAMTGRHSLIKAEAAERFLAGNPDPDLP
jgi:hypothetical protein